VSGTRRGAQPRAGWVPDRQEVVWIDYNPQAGREMRDVHPFLVLSPRSFNERTSLVIGLPMTTAEYNADNPFAVAVGSATGRKTGKTIRAVPPAQVVRLAYASRLAPSFEASRRRAIRGSVCDTEPDRAIGLASDLGTL